MTDLELLHAVEHALPGLDAFHRDLYALARLRVARGEPLKATQRSQLARVIHLAMQTRLQTMKARWTDEGESGMAKGERMKHG